MRHQAFAVLPPRPRDTIPDLSPAWEGDEDDWEDELETEVATLPKARSVARLPPARSTIRPRAPEANTLISNGGSPPCTKQVITLPIAQANDPIIEIHMDSV